MSLRAGVGALPGESVTLPVLPTCAGEAPPIQLSGPVRVSHATCGFAVPLGGPLSAGSISLLQHLEPDSRHGLVRMSGSEATLPQRRPLREAFSQYGGSAL